MSTPPEGTCGKTPLSEYLSRYGPSKVEVCADGAPLNPVRFPVASIEVVGAILFADLTRYSRIARDLTPTECAYLVSQFFAWFEGEAGRHYGGVVDKFIGDELMMVFLPENSSRSPLEAALRTAKAAYSGPNRARIPRVIEQ
jgi:class 3 adenylate cyclase